MQKLSIEVLVKEAKAFCEKESKYDYVIGSSANGIDMPTEDINTDIKVTSIKQPQSSCPFRNARQKIYGLGYNLLVFVYEKNDDPAKKYQGLIL